LIEWLSYYLIRPRISSAKRHVLNIIEVDPVLAKGGFPFWFEPCGEDEYWRQPPTNGKQLRKQCAEIDHRKAPR